MGFESKFVGLMKGIFGVSPSASGGIAVPSGAPNFPPVQIGGNCGFFYSGSAPYGVFLGATIFGWNATSLFVAAGKNLIFNDIAGDIGFARLATNVLGLITAGAGTAGGWLQLTGGRGFSTADATSVTAVMAAIDGTKLNFNVLAGRKYTGLLTFFASDTVAADGIAIDFNGGTATMTNFRAGFEGTPVGATLGVNNSTALATALTATTVSTADVCYSIAFSFTVNAAGTFIPRFAQAAHSTGTGTIRLGAACWIEDMP